MALKRVLRSMTLTSLVLLSHALAGAREVEQELSAELKAYLERPEAELDIGRGALLMAKEEMPGLALPIHLAALDRMADTLKQALTRAGTAQERLDVLRGLIFDVEGFGLPEKDDAAAFLLPSVLEHKRGNCLGLSVLCLALGERAGLKLHGVPVPSRRSGPGHLLVRYDDGLNRINFDATEKGAAHSDQYYVKMFNLKAEDLKKGYVLGNATRKAVLNLILVNLGGERVLAGRAQEALVVLKAAEALDPLYAPVHHNLGSAHLELGHEDAAEKAYQKALQVDPGFAGAQLGMGSLALRRGNVERAEREVMSVLAVEPQNRAAKSLLANVHLQKHAFGVARGVLAELVREDPNDLQTQCNLGTTLLMGGDYDEAAMVFRNVVALDAKCADAHHGLGQVAQALGRQGEAQEAFRKALAIDRDHVPTRLSQAQASTMIKDYAQAEAGYQAILLLRPQHLEALGGLSQVFIAQRKFKEAEGLLRTFVDAHPGQTSLLMLLGDVRLGAGNVRGALTLLEQALKTVHEDARTPLMQRIAVCHGRLGNHGKAYETADAILGTRAEDLPALRVAAAACEGLRDRVKAIQFYRRILALAPDDLNAKKALARLGERN